MSETSAWMQCPTRYEAINGQCYHYMWPPSAAMLAGTLLLSLTNSLSTLAGLGGGSIALVILMSFFHYLPKDATLVVISCILGTSAGNTTNLIKKAYNGKPLVQYQYAFVSIPVVFMGSLIGVILNKLFPSIVTYSIIIGVFLVSMSKTYNRFISEYRKETAEIENHLESGLHLGDMHEETEAQPFEDDRTVYILKNIGVVMLITIILSFVRGSSKFPSIIGLSPCSGTYWLVFCLSFGVLMLYAYRNLQIFKTWHAEAQKQGGLGREGQPKDELSSHVSQLVTKSICAGVFSGFGLGGGIFLVPMYRNLGCKPLEATATCAFGIFITSLINCFQAVAMGVIQISQILYFVVFLGLMAYAFSKVISSQLRKRNRFSLVEGILLVLTVIAIVNIPISLYSRYVDNNRNLAVIVGFGHIC